MDENVNLNHKTLLVTGAAGFIGAALSMALLQRMEGVTVVGYDCVNDYYEVSLKEWRLKEIEKVAAQTGNTWKFILDSKLAGNDVPAWPGMLSRAGRQGWPCWLDWLVNCSG